MDIKHILEWDVFTKIYACVVPGEEQVCFRITESNNHKDIGKTLPPSPASYKVFLVNEGDLDITSVEVYTGGFEGDVELNRMTKHYGALKKGTALFLEELDYGLLDFVLWYELRLCYSDGTHLEAQFSIGKAYALKERNYCFSSVLNRKAYCFNLNPINKEEEIAKT